MQRPLETVTNNRRNSFTPAASTTPLQQKPVVLVGSGLPEASSNLYCVAYELRTDGQIVAVRLESPRLHLLEAYFCRSLCELDKRGALSPAQMEFCTVRLKGNWQLWYALLARATQPVNTEAHKWLGDCDNNNHISDRKWYGRILLCRPTAAGILHTVSLYPEDVSAALEAVRCALHTSWSTDRENVKQ